MKLLLHIDDSISAQEVADAGMEMFTSLPWCTKAEIVHDGCGECARQHKGSSEQTAHNTARAEICAPCSQESSYINEMVFIASDFKFCPWCGRKLSPIA